MAFGDASTLQTSVISTPSGAPTNIFGTWINGWTEIGKQFLFLCEKRTLYENSNDLDVVEKFSQTDRSRQLASAWPDRK